MYMHKHKLPILSLQQLYFRNAHTSCGRNHIYYYCICTIRWVMAKQMSLFLSILCVNGRNEMSPSGSTRGLFFMVVLIIYMTPSYKYNDV